MPVKRTVTCQSLDLGLAMVAGQHQTIVDDDLDARIAETQMLLYILSCTVPRGCLVSRSNTTKEATAQIMQLQQDMAAFDGAEPQQGCCMHACVCV